jgi:hypothetical protein
MFKANLVKEKKKYDITAQVDGFTNGITYFSGNPTAELQQHTKSMRVKSHLLCT